MQKKAIKGFTLEELKQIICKEGFPSYRTKQIFHWIQQKKVNSFREMKNLPKDILNWLDSNFLLEQIKYLHRIKSQDGSEKFLFQLYDNHLIESVFIKGKKRNTICLSSQVGCLWHCLFCASGQGGFKRNLLAAEIIDQILSIERITKEKADNIVFMGMGEPFNNYNNVIKSIQIINSKDGLNIGIRKITISTCGIIPGIIKLSESPLQVELSVSLHSADDKTRTRLMPVNLRYPLKELISTCKYYTRRKNRQITFEYLMLDGINDSIEDANKLSKMISDFEAKVNLIYYNALTAEKYLAPTDEKTISVFMEKLRSKHIPVTIRYSRGSDIQAACGQLRSQYQNDKVV